MPSARTRKWGIAALAAALILAAGVMIGLRIAAGIIKGKVVEALGPESEIGNIQLGWWGLEIQGLRIKGGQGWPAADALRVERVAIAPSLRSLFSDAIRIRSITIVRPSLTAVRSRDGRLHVLPSLLEERPSQEKAPAGSSTWMVVVSRTTLEDGVLEFFDAAVAQPPVRVRLEKIQGTLTDLLVPGLNRKSQFDLAAVVKGVNHDGRATLAGWAEIATKDSSVKTELRGVDLVALQPYLVKAAETRLRRGALDLDLQSEVAGNRLRAPGRVVISDLEFAPAAGPLDTFMGVPRTAVVNFLKNKDKKIAVNFVIEGDINNPHFTLREALAMRIGSGMAELLGVSLRGVAEGVGTLGQKGVEATGEAVKGLEGALQDLVGGKKKR
jgi:uncharacterized protein involved in outer membrane biogenesis